jgi:hypothetical protein
MTRKSNWLPWAGFGLSIIAFASYFLLFYQFPVTRDFPWVNLLLFAAAAVMLAIGLRRAFAAATGYRGKISAPILAALGAGIFGFFVFAVFVSSRHLPPSLGAPKVGQKAPEFSLTDTAGESVSLSKLLSAQAASSSARTKGVLLIFYRGFW